MNMRRQTSRLAAVLAGAIVILQTSCSSLRHAAPIAWSERDLDGSLRRRVAGPIGEFSSATNGMSLLAVRPFYCRTTDPERDRALDEYLWPLGMDKSLGSDRYWRVLSVFGHDFGEPNPTGRYRVVVFPLAAWGRDAEGKKYFGVFPLGGEVHEFLGFDRIAFAAFPLYLDTRINDLRTRDILWPFISWTEGEGVWRFRFFPFYGLSEREGEWRKGFALWPVWTWCRYEGERGPTGSGFIFFPLFGHVGLTDQETWMILPPLFRWSSNDRGYRSMNCPWPFFQYVRAKDESKTYLWPLWGVKKLPDASFSFLLWPIGSRLRLDRGDERIERTVLFPLWFHETRENSRGGAPSGGEAAGRYAKLWPLFSYRREEDTTCLRVPDLWPGKQLSPVERNWAPFWTLYQREGRRGEGGEELLWGLYRRRWDERGGFSVSLFPLFSMEKNLPDDIHEWNLLLGLVGRRREGLRSNWRIMYFIRLGSDRE